MTSLDAIGTDFIVDDVLQDSQSRAILAKCQLISKPKQVDKNFITPENTEHCEVAGKEATKDDYNAFVDARMGEDK
jgi:hypothetical protein